MRSYSELTQFMGLNEVFTKDIRKRALFRNSARYEQELAFIYSLFFNSFGMVEGTCPETMDERTVKRAIIGTAKYCRWLENGVPFGLPCNYGGNFTKMYAYPTNAYVYSYMGYFKDVKCMIPNGNGGIVRETIGGGEAEDNDEKGFIIKANQLDYAPISYITQVAYDLSDTLRTLEVQRTKMKAPGILGADERIINKVRQNLESMENNEEIINVGRVGSTTTSVQDALGMVPYLIPSDVHHETKDDYEWYSHQFMNRIGFNTNSSPDKAANLTEDEVNADALLSAFNIQSMVDYLNYQEEIANKEQGTNIKWEVKHKLPKFETTETTKKESEVKEDE